MYRLPSQKNSDSNKEQPTTHSLAADSIRSPSAETINPLQLTPSNLFVLQRTIGNRALSRLLSQSNTQPPSSLINSNVPHSTPTSEPVQRIVIQKKYDPNKVPYKTEKSLIDRANELYEQREDMLDKGDISGIYSIGGDFEELKEIAIANGWLEAYDLLIKWGEMIPGDEEEEQEFALYDKVAELEKKLKGLKSEVSDASEEINIIMDELRSIEHIAAMNGWNHIVNYARKVGKYTPVVYGNPSGDTTNSMDADKLDEIIKNDVPDPEEAMGIIEALESQASESLKKDKDEIIDFIKSTIDENIELSTKENIKIIKSFINTYKTAQTRKFNFDKCLQMLYGVLTTGLKRRTESPEIEVTGEPFNPELPEREDYTGIHMSEIESKYDVLARKSGAPEKDGELIPGAVHEVDLAFLDGMRGIADYRVTLTEEEPVLGGGDGGGEKVYALGHTGAINFEGALSNRGGERLYGVLFPPGFMDRYGLDLRTKGISGKSAQTPVDQDFAQGYMYDDKEKTHRVEIPSTKAFAIRAEDNTPDGQAHIHFSRSNMNIHGKKMSQLEFMRLFVIGVVEFNMQGFVINIKYF